MGVGSACARDAGAQLASFVATDASGVLEPASHVPATSNAALACSVATDAFGGSPKDRFALGTRTVQPVYFALAGLAGRCVLPASLAPLTATVLLASFAPDCETSGSQFTTGRPNGGTALHASREAPRSTLMSPAIKYRFAHRHAAIDRLALNA
jgi:hypothetical protein